MSHIQNSLEKYETKINLCVLRTQQGKTYQAIKRIAKEIDEDELEGRSIHIVQTMNTLLNNRQLTSRLYKVQKICGVNSVVVLSSDKSFYSESNKKKTRRYIKFWNEEMGGDVMFPQFNTLESLKLHITNIMLTAKEDELDNQLPKVIVMCCNKTRFDDMYGSEGLVKFFEDCFQKKKGENCQSEVQRVFCYIDEMHEYINDTLRSQLEYISKFDIVESIIGFTATPDTIFIPNDQFWKNLRIIELSNYNDKNYVGAHNHDWINVDDYLLFQKESYKKPGPFEYEKKAKHVLGFIEHVFQKFSKDIFEKKARIFAPGHIKEDSHSRVMELIFKFCPECVVVILNSKNKMLVYMDTNKTQHNILLSSLQKQSGEVSEDIYSLLKEHKLVNRPVCYTGMLCIGMGQTLMSKKLGVFTSTILSHLDLKNDDIYQLFGRTTGNFRDWFEDLVRNKIYCPSIIMNRCITMELCAARMVDYQGETIDRENYREMMQSRMGQDCLNNLSKDKILKKVSDKKSHEEDMFEGGQVWFDTKEEVIQYYKDTGSDRAPPFKEPNNYGFEKGSVSGPLEVLTRIKLDTLIKGKKTAKFNTDGAKPNSFYRLLYPYYTNPNDNTTLKYCVRWLKHKDLLSDNHTSSTPIEVGARKIKDISEDKKKKKRRTKNISEEKKKSALETLKLNEQEFLQKVKKTTVPFLKQYCEAFGIPKSGLKDELVQKLLSIFQ